MMEKTIEIGGKPVRFKATAAVPLLYRRYLHRDMMQDSVKLAKEIEAARKEGSLPPTECLTIFENMAFVMAKHADPAAGETVEGWLEQFDQPLALYERIEEIMELWGENMASTAIAKKKEGPANGK